MGKNKSSSFSLQSCANMFGGVEMRIFFIEGSPTPSIKWALKDQLNCLQIEIMRGKFPMNKQATTWFPNFAKANAALLVINSCAAFKLQIVIFEDDALLLIEVVSNHALLLNNFGK